MRPAAPTSKQALIDGATTLFLEQGFDAVSMEQVRLKANVSNGSLFHHFQTKAHLGRSVYLEALINYHKYMLRGMDESTTAEEGVRGLVARHIAWVVRNPRLALVLDRLRAITAIDGQEPDWGATNAQAFTYLESWIALQLARGEMRSLPFKVWIALVLGPALQLTPAWARMGKPAVAAPVRKALADAAWSAVSTAPPTKERT